MLHHETGMVSSVKKIVTGRDVNELDEFHHRLMLTNTPTKKQKLIEDIESSINSAESKLKSPGLMSSSAETLRSQLEALKSVLSKVKSVKIDYDPLDHNYQESAMVEDMSAGLTSVSASKTFVKNYSFPQPKIASTTAGVAYKPNPVVGLPNENELPLDSLSGKILKTVKQAMEDNALDKMSNSLAQRASNVQTDTQKEELQKEVRNKMIEAESLIRSATSFTNSERPKLLTSIHTFIDQMRSIESKLGAAQPDQIRDMLHGGKVFTESMFGGRKYNLYKKSFATTELHDVIGGMALEGGLDVQRVAWYNRFSKIETAAEASAFIGDATKAIDIMGTVHQEVSEVDKPNNNSEKVDAKQRETVKTETLKQINYLESLCADLRKKFPAA